MPIPIIIAILLALFTLETALKNEPVRKPEKIVILGGKNNNDRTISMGQQETAFFTNIFQCTSLYQIIKEEPLTSIHSINSNIKQAIVLSEKE